MLPQLAVAVQQCSYKLKDTAQRSPSDHQTAPKDLDLCSVRMHAANYYIIYITLKHSRISALPVQACDRKHELAR
jgi:hypothetical protein